MAELTSDILLVLGEQFAEHDELEDTSLYYSNKRAMYAAVLVSRLWNACLTPYLYRKYQNMDISSAYGSTDDDGSEEHALDEVGQPLLPFLRTVLDRPDLARHVRTVGLRAWRIKQDLLYEGDEVSHLASCTPSAHKPGLHRCLRAALRDRVQGGYLNIRTFQRGMPKTPWDDANDDNVDDGSRSLIRYYWKDALLLLLLCAVPNVERLTMVSHRGGNNSLSPFSWHVHLSSIAHGFRVLQSFRIASVHEWAQADHSRYWEVDDCKSYEWDWILSLPVLRRLSVDDWHIGAPLQSSQVEPASNHITHLKLRHGRADLENTHAIIRSCKALAKLEYVDSISGEHSLRPLDFELLATQFSTTLTSLRLHVPAANPSLRRGALRAYPALKQLSLSHEVIFGSSHVATGVPLPETVESSPALVSILPPNVEELELLNGTTVTSVYLVSDFLQEWHKTARSLRAVRLDYVGEHPLDQETIQGICELLDIGLAFCTTRRTQYGTAVGFTPKARNDTVYAALERRTFWRGKDDPMPRSVFFEGEHDAPIGSLV